MPPIYLPHVDSTACIHVFHILLICPSSRLSPGVNPTNYPSLYNYVVIAFDVKFYKTATVALLSNPCERRLCILFEKQSNALRSHCDYMIHHDTEEDYVNVNALLNFRVISGDVVDETYLATQNKIGNSERTDCYHLGAEYHVRNGKAVFSYISAHEKQQSY